MKLSAKARAMLRNGPLHAELSLLAVSAGGSKQSENEPLAIKAAPKKKGGAR